MSKDEKERSDSGTCSFLTRFHRYLNAIPLIRGISASRKACYESRDRVPQDGAPIFVLVHGTWNIRAKWAKEDSHLFEELSRLWPRSGIYRFIWSAANGIRQRLVAADVLSEILNQIEESHPSSPIVVIAHSHGGNVAAWASTKVKKRLAAAVYMSTPFIQALAPTSTSSFFLRVVLLIAGAIFAIPLVVAFNNLFLSDRDGSSLLFWNLGAIGLGIAATQLVVPWVKRLRQRVVEYSNCKRNISKELSAFVVGDEPASALGAVYLIQWLGQKIIAALLFAIPIWVIAARFIKPLYYWFDQLLPYIASGIVAIYALYLTLAISAYGLLQGFIALDATMASTPAPQGKTDFVTIAWSNQSLSHHSVVHDSCKAITAITDWLTVSIGLEKLS